MCIFARNDLSCHLLEGIFEILRNGECQGSFFAFKEMIYDPVFKRMVRNHSEPSAGIKLFNRNRQKIFARLQKTVR